MTGAQATDRPDVTITHHRVDYSETDQMGVVYHARYLVWLDVARTEYLRRSGTSYRELELAGLRLMVSEATVRYRRAVHYDDLVRVRAWVREVASRKIVFGYAVEHDERGELLATATTSLLVMSTDFTFARLPSEVVARLHPIPDPVRL
jgi:acyl-CoA thioester hydrolase